MKLESYFALKSTEKIFFMKSLRKKTENVG